jgi:hypothetical protein
MAARGAIAVDRGNLGFDVPGGGEPGDFAHKAAVAGGGVILIEPRSVKKIALSNYRPGFIRVDQAFPPPVWPTSTGSAALKCPKSG